jgi:glutamyl-tRNA reductase
VLVVGAGEMGEGVANALQHAGAGDITVINRTPARAVEIAERIGASVRAFKDLDKAMIDADVVLTCTGSGTLVIERDTVENVQEVRGHAPLLIVDIAVPRDVDSTVEAVRGVMLRNLDHLRDWAARGIAMREAEAQMVRVIINDEVDRFISELTARQAAPLVSELYERADQLRLSELDRYSSKLSGLTAEQTDAVDALTKGIIAKFLHPISVHLKDDAGTPQGERNAAAVRDLFDLH